MSKKENNDVSKNLPIGIHYFVLETFFTMRLKTLVSVRSMAVLSDPLLSGEAAKRAPNLLVDSLLLPTFALLGLFTRPTKTAIDSAVEP